MININYKSWKILPVILFVFLAVNFLVAPHKAKAINNTIITATTTELNSANTNPANQTFSPWLAVGVGQYNGPYSQAKVYTKGNSTLTINQAPCATDVGAPSVTYYVTKLQTSGSREIGITSAGQSGPKGAGTCGQSFTIALTGGIPSTLPGHENWSTFYVSAIMDNSPGSGDNERSFRISVDNGGLTGLSRTEFCGTNFNPCGPGNIEAYTGIYARNLGTGVGPQSSMWDYAVQFAPRCGEPVGGGTSVSLYDMDPSVYSPQNLSAELQKDDRTNGSFNWATINNKTSFNSGSGKFDAMSFTSSQADRYKLTFRGINWRNTIQVFIPYDQFDAQASVGQACNSTGNVTCTATPILQSVARNSGSIITIEGFSTKTWKNSYYVKRTGPIPTTITAPGSQTFQDSVVFNPVFGTPR